MVLPSRIRLRKSIIFILGFLARSMMQSSLKMFVALVDQLGFVNPHFQHMPKLVELVESAKKHMKKKSKLMERKPKK